MPEKRWLGPHRLQGGRTDIQQERSHRESEFAGNGRVGLVLPGGGARGAYQVGVLHAISDLLPDNRNPFPVIVGASVGAINAAAVACQAWNFKPGVERLVELWSALRTSDVYRTDLLTITRYGLRWLLSLTFGGLNYLNPRSTAVAARARPVAHPRGD